MPIAGARSLVWLYSSRTVLRGLLGVTFPSPSVTLLSHLSPEVGYAALFWITGLQACPVFRRALAIVATQDGIPHYGEAIVVSSFPHSFAWSHTVFLLVDQHTVTIRRASALSSYPAARSTISEVPEPVYAMRMFP